MKFTPVLFAAGVAAAVYRRQVDVVQSNLESIKAAVDTLTTGINAFAGPADVDSLLASANAVGETISAANTNIENGVADTSITIDEGFPVLQYLSSQLVPSVQASVSAATGKVDTFAAACQAAVVLGQLQGFRTASAALIETVVTKVADQDAADLARAQSQPILDSLDEGIAAFTGVEEGPDCGETPPTESSSTSTSAAPTGPAPTSSVPSATSSPSGPAPTVIPTPTGGRPPVGTPVPTPTSGRPQPPAFTGAADSTRANMGALAFIAVAAVAAF